MTEQTLDPAPVSPTVALIDARLAELAGGPESIGIQEGRVAQAAAELAAAEERLAGCLAEKTKLETDRALLAPAEPEPGTDEPTDPEASA